MLKTKLLGATAAAELLAIEDVFSTYLYTGNGSTQTITNGIDLAGEGGLVWTKSRSGAYSHGLYDTERGATKELKTDATTAQSTDNGVTVFNSNGYDVGARFTTNNSSDTYASWTFRKAPRFFDVVTYTGNGTAGRTIAHNLGVVPGCIIVKQTNTSGSSWAVYHRGTDSSSPQNYHLELDNTNARDGTGNRWNNTAPTSTVFSVGSATAVNANSSTYVAYLFAHDPLGPSGDGSDGLIACGSYTGNGSTNGPEINLGWEPQWVLVKGASQSGNWVLMDNMRGIAAGGIDPTLFANSANAEDLTNDYLSLLPTGFKLTASSSAVNSNTQTYIYIAIRRGPMREPTSGTEVFDVETSTSATPRTWNSGFPVDLSIYCHRDTFTSNKYVGTRITGNSAYLVTNATSAESSSANLVQFDHSDKIIENNLGGTNSKVNWMFRRAPGFFDVVAYAGTGTERGVPHNLGVTPEMLIIKARDFSGKEWFVHHTGLTSWSKVLQLQSTGTESNGDTGGNLPTETTFPVNASSNVNGSGYNYIAYLFATLPGISKVGSYTGNGSSQTINCSFTGGARFVLIKRTDSTGDWYVWDTARGIVSGNDPRLSLNTTAAEVTSDDTIDPDSSGFIVNQVAATNVNVSSASYIYLAIA